MLRLHCQMQVTPLLMLLLVLHLLINYNHILHYPHLSHIDVPIIVIGDIIALIVAIDILITITLLTIWQLRSVDGQILGWYSLSGLIVVGLMIGHGKI